MTLMPQVAADDNYVAVSHDGHDDDSCGRSPPADLLVPERKSAKPSRPLSASLLDRRD